MILNHVHFQPSMPVYTWGSSCPYFCFQIQWSKFRSENWLLSWILWALLSRSSVISISGTRTKWTDVMENISSFAIILLLLFFFFIDYHGIGRRHSVIHLHCYFKLSRYALAFCVPLLVYVQWSGPVGYSSPVQMMLQVIYLCWYSVDDHWKIVGKLKRVFANSFNFIWIWKS